MKHETLALNNVVGLTNIEVLLIFLNNDSKSLVVRGHNAGCNYGCWYYDLSNINLHEPDCVMDDYGNRLALDS